MVQRPDDYEYDEVVEQRRPVRDYVPKKEVRLSTSGHHNYARVGRRAELERDLDSDHDDRTYHQRPGQDYVPGIPGNQSFQNSRMFDQH